jgi:hypothetical protein
MQTELHPLFAAYLSHLKRKGRDQKTIDRNRYFAEAVGRMASKGGRRSAVRN